MDSLEQSSDPKKFALSRWMDDKLVHELVFVVLMAYVLVPSEDREPCLPPCDT